ncbi:MAG TPA: glycosyltransferase family 4 protein [Acidimicrobiales bacterium]|nr:glycosyltransferase family 4 protein [Acidimicrobiales bacterium]
MAPLRVALVHPFSWPEVRRGGERLLHDLAWYLARAGHRVDVITGAWAGASVERTPEGAVVRRYQLRELAPLRRVGAGPMETFGGIALGALLRRRYDVVHSLTPTGVLAARLSGHPVVFTVLGHPTAEDFALQPGGRRLFERAVRAAAVTITLSRSAAAQMEGLTGARLGGTGRRRLRVVPPGVRLETFSPDLQPRAGPVRLLFPSDASEIRKGVHHVLAALPLVRKRHPDARLVLCGPGAPDWAVAGVGGGASAVLARADPLAVAGLGAEGVDALELTERIDDVRPEQLPALYRGATVTVLPSWHEAFGLVLAESLACGTPVACYAEAGMVDVVNAPGIGQAATPFGDIPALAEAIGDAVDLARAPGTPERCADHARTWGWDEAVGPAHEELYRSVVG